MKNYINKIFGCAILASATMLASCNAHTSVAITIKPEDGNKWTWGVPLNETDYNADATAPKIN